LTLIPVGPLGTNHTQGARRVQRPREVVGAAVRWITCARPGYEPGCDRALTADGLSVIGDIVPHTCKQPGAIGEGSRSIES